MIRTSRASLATKILLSLVLLSIAALVPGTAAFGAEATIVYKHESFPEYQQQLATGQIQAVTINKRVRSIHITLKDGSHVLAKYAAHEEPAVVAALAAKGITATIESKAAAAKEAKAVPVKHKLRYIAGGILVVVVAIVGAVLIIDRKRKREQE